MKRLVVGTSWKMTKTRPEAREFVRVLRRELPALDTRRVRAYILPAFTALETVGRELDGYPVELGAQDMFWEESGAYTGEVSPVMLRELGCTLVMLGHSERRRYFGETDEALNKKVRAALEHSLTPLLCVGETAEERDAGQTIDVLRCQLATALAGVSADRVEKALLLYEPRWAIGQPHAAPLAYVQATHELVRRVLAELYGAELARRVSVLYGGSVNLENFIDILSLPDVDGCGISRAAWDAANFAQLIRWTVEVAEKKKMMVE